MDRVQLYLPYIIAFYTIFGHLLLLLLLLTCVLVFAVGMLDVGRYNTITVTLFVGRENNENTDIVCSSFQCVMRRIFCTYSFDESEMQQKWSILSVKALNERWNG